ncbi:MAG TPA: methyl-accepting chemotaxis protein [bacterium]|nr:methyl-accepting chemotaxis protein [bacterium]HPQ19663.1 methyl-accepting chemotaxis protein [bacterium]
MKNINIKLKLVFLITALIIIIMVLVGIISLNREENNIRKQIKILGFTLARTLSLSSIEPLLKGDFATLNNYIKNLSEIKLESITEEQVNKKEKIKDARYELLNYIFILSEDNKILVHNNPLLENKNINEEIIKEELRIKNIKHKAYLLIPENQEIKGINELINYTLYINNYSNYLNYIFPEDYLRNFRIKKNIFKKIEEIELNEEKIKEIKKEKAVIGVSQEANKEEVKIKGFKKIFVIENIKIMDITVPIKSEEMYYGSLRLGMSLKVIDEELKKAKLYIATLTLIGIILGIFGANIMSQKMTQPIFLLVNTVTKIAKGDLKNRANIMTSDEIEKLANSINLMAEELLNIVHKINSSAFQLIDTSNSIYTTSKKSKDNISEIENKINIINIGVKENTESLNKIVSSINELTASAKNIFQNSEAVKSFSESTSEKAREGMNAVKIVNTKITEIQAGFNNIAEMVLKLNNSIIKIGNITSLITRITKKTNTLAYNVNLAASKSESRQEVIKEISAQVRNLSDEIAESTLEIAGIIEEIKLNMEQVLISIKAGEEKVIEGNKSVVKANNSLVEIVNNINNVKNMLNRITKLSENQLVNSENATKDIHNISIITNKTDIEVSKILNNIEEQVELIKISFEKANELFLLANQLKREIVSFKI